MEDIESPVTTSTERFVMRGKPAKDDTGTLAKSSVTSKPRKCCWLLPFCLIIRSLHLVLNSFVVWFLFLLLMFVSQPVAPFSCLLSLFLSVSVSLPPLSPLSLCLFFNNKENCMCRWCIYHSVVFCRSEARQKISFCPGDVWHGCDFIFSQSRSNGQWEPLQVQVQSPVWPKARWVTTLSFCLFFWLKEARSQVLHCTCFWR